MKIKTERRILILTFLILPLLHLFIFAYIPIILNFVLSFSNWNGLDIRNINFIGFRNYERLFTDPQFLLLFRNTLWYMLMAIPQLVLSFVLAIFVNGKFKGLNFFKGVLIFPFLLNGIIISAIFIIFFNPTGTLNTILEAVGLGFLTRNWLQQLSLVNPAIASVSIWRFYGFSFLIFFGALQAIPEEIYEAAAIDGCTKWKETLYISMPFVRKVLFINILLSVSGSIQVFEIPFIIMNGTNNTGTPVIHIHHSMLDGRIGQAAATSIVVFLVVLVTVSVQRLLFGEEKKS